MRRDDGLRIETGRRIANFNFSPVLLLELFTGDALMVSWDTAAGVRLWSFSWPCLAHISAPFENVKYLLDSCFVLLFIVQKRKLMPRFF